MAKGVAKSFRKHLASFINFYVAMENGNQADEKSIRTLIKEYLPSIKSTEAERETLRIALVALQIIIDKEHLVRIVEKAYQQTRKDDGSQRSIALDALRGADATVLCAETAFKEVIHIILDAGCRLCRIIIQVVDVNVSQLVCFGKTFRQQVFIGIIFSYFGERL